MHGHLYARARPWISYTSPPTIEEGGSAGTKRGFRSPAAGIGSWPNDGEELVSEDSEAPRPRPGDSEVPTWEDDDSIPPRTGHERSAAANTRADAVRVAIAGSVSSTRLLPTLTALCAELGRELGRPTSGHVMFAYDELLGGAERDDFHLLWLPPLIAQKAIASGSVTALVVPVRAGSTGYATALFTRDDSDIVRVEQLAGTRVGWVDESSLAGYVLPRAMLTGRGLDLDGLFASEKLLGSHEAVVAAVLSKDVDAGATYARVERDRAGGADVVSSKALEGTATRILAHHGPVPADILAVGRGVDAATRDRLRRCLVTEPDAELTRLSCRLLECDGFELLEPYHLRVLEKLSREA